jgi:hypothetical protein
MIYPNTKTAPDARTIKSVSAQTIASSLSGELVEPGSKEQS